MPAAERYIAINYIEEYAMKFIKIIFVIGSLLSIQCSDSTSSNNSENDFSIYLLKDTLLTTSDVKTSRIDSLDIQAEPIINLKDIVSYDWSSHKMVLQSDAFERFKTLDTNNISTYGMPFIVIVHGERIYLGNIYPYYSSYMHFDLPSINIAPFMEMKINRASDEFEDKRNDWRILSILQDNNKIKI